MRRERGAEGVEMTWVSRGRAETVKVMVRVCKGAETGRFRPRCKRQRRERTCEEKEVGR